MHWQGLSEAEVAERTLRGEKNSLPVDNSRSLSKQLLGVLKEPMMALLLIAALLSLALGDIVEAIALLISVTFVIGIALFQVRRTDKALAALRVLSTPRAAVYRDGELRQVPSQDLVLDDLVLLKEGDRVPADCVILESSSLTIDESILTGESIAVEKAKDDLALSGSLVVRGHAVGKVNAVGLASQLGQLGKWLVGAEKRTVLQVEVDSIVRVVAIVAIATAVTVSVVYAMTRGDWLVGSLAGIAAAMALLPEELPIVLTIFLGLGAWRMAKAGVIVRSNPAIEMLGQITVLCVDKTGTITENEMTLVTDDSQTLRFGALASIPDSFDPIDKAFLRAASVDQDLTLVREFSLSDENPFFCQIWREPSGSLVAAIKGAPERVVELCQLPDSRKTQILNQLDEGANKGLRILAVAKASAPESILDAKNALSLNFEFVGLAAMKDPIRKGVDQAISELRRAGVRTVIITGDYPQTAEAIGREVGLLSNEKSLSGEMLQQLSAVELERAVRAQSVFSRVKPQQKLMIIKELQRQGEIVAMTGDGVNDSPALKAANVGIAMGKRGSEVAREAADLVIADDSFLSITEGVRAGRRIFSNLRKAASYVIAIHVPIFGMALVPIASPVWPLVLLPIQIAILEIIIDPSASLVYEAEKSTKDQMLKPPRPIGDRMVSSSVLKLATSQGLILFAGALTSFLISLSLGAPDDEVRSVTFGTILLGNLLLMLTNRSSTASIFELISGRINRLAIYIFSAGLLFMFSMFSVSQIRAAFNLSELGVSEIVVILVCALPAPIWFEIYKFSKRRKLASSSLT
jgi:P-type Ca2+ transporter type 2C